MSALEKKEIGVIIAMYPGIYYPYFHYTATTPVRGAYSNCEAIIVYST